MNSKCGFRASAFRAGSARVVLRGFRAFRSSTAAATATTTTTAPPATTTTITTTTPPAPPPPAAAATRFNSILRAASARLRFARVSRVLFCAGSARFVLRLRLVLYYYYY